MNHRRQASSVFLAALILEQAQSLTSSLNTATTAALGVALASGYINAYTAGALWALLNLIRKPVRHPSKLEAGTNFTQHLRGLALEAGLAFNLTRPEPRATLINQIGIATQKLEEYRSITGGLSSGADARAAVYGTRWAVQQAQADVGQYSSAANGLGEVQELLKTWIRLSARAEHRNWHDALEGKTIPYSQKFRLEGPNGLFLVDRPYDPILPLSETMRCGHGLRVDPPDGSSVTPWDGS